MPMWKRDNEVQPTPIPSQRPNVPAPSAAHGTARATIGASITIKGHVLGNEDLHVEGNVEGEIRLPKNSVTIGRSGSVRADIFAKSIKVIGEVIGNLLGEEEVIIESSGTVEGNITSPRVTLDDGCKFRGSIDMQAKNKPTTVTQTAQPPTKPASAVTSAAAAKN